MQKYKGVDERKQTLDVRIYPVVSVGTKPSLIHVVEAHAKSIAFRLSSLFRGSLDLPQRLDH
jgi:hypothetical protein